MKKFDSKSALENNIWRIDRSRTLVQNILDTYEILTNVHISQIMALEKENEQLKERLVLLALDIIRRDGRYAKHD